VFTTQEFFTLENDLPSKTIYKPPPGGSAKFRDRCSIKQEKLLMAFCNDPVAPEGLESKQREEKRVVLKL